MAKANQKNKKNKKPNKMNAGFDVIIKALEDIIATTEELMPLVSDSLKLTVKLVRLYKKSFNAGIKYAKQK